LLEEKFAIFGTKWQAIASFFPARSRNDVKYHWLQKQRQLARLAASDLPQSVLPEKPRTEGVKINKFSLTEMVPIPIVPRGQPCQD
jgi:hypothetical protein